MLYKIAETICLKFLVAGVVTEKDKPIIIYGIELILSTVGAILSVFLLACIFASPIYCMMFICFFVLQRFFIGGFHCSTYLKCFFTTNFIFLLLLFLTYITPRSLHLPLCVFLTVVSLPVAFVKTPVLNAHNPISQKRISRDKLYGRYILVFQASIIVMCALLSFADITLLYFCSLNYFAATLLMLIPNLSKS